MRGRHTLLTAGAACIALVLVAIWQVPGWLNWTHYRTTIEVLASATLGQPVKIQGPISLTLLPQPILTAADVNVGDSDAAGLSIHVDALRLRVALWPLVAGRVDARELVLRGPDLRIPWPAEAGALLPRPPSWLAAFAARIENGRLTIGQLAVTGVDATLATLETGTLSAVGTAQFSGQGWHFAARLTTTGPDGVAGLSIALDGQGKANGLGATFTGRFSGDGTLSGAITSRGPNLGVLLPAPPVPFRADGRLTVSGGLAIADELSLEIGGSPASGAVALRVAPQQRLDIALAASRLDLDAWLPVLLRAGTTIVGTNVPTGIDLSAEAAPFGGGTLQRLRAAFDLTADELIVRDASAVLPGDAMLRMTGKIARTDPTNPRFEGETSLSAPVSRTTLRWFQDAWPTLLPADLGTVLLAGAPERVQLSAHALVSSGEFVLTHLGGTVDDTKIAGSIGIKRGEPPFITADVTLDHVAFGSWLPADLLSLGQLSRLGSGIDAELRLAIGQAKLGAVDIRGLSVDGAFEAGALRLRRFEGTAAGMAITASGTVGESGRVTGGRLSAATLDATPVAQLLPPVWRATPALWHGPAKLDVQAEGPPEALTLGIKLAMADARLEAVPVFDLRSSEWAGPVTLRHPGARRFLATLGIPERLGLPFLTAWLGDGSLSLVANLSAAPERLEVKRFDVSGGALHAIGGLTIAQPASQPHVTGQVLCDTLTLPLPSAYTEVPLPLGLFAGWQAELSVQAKRLLAGPRAVLRQASGNVVLVDGALHIDQFTAKLGAGTLSGKAAFDATARPPTLMIQGALKDAKLGEPLSGLPVDLVSGHADGTIEFTASGYSPTAILATLNGRASLTVTDGTMTGIDLFRIRQAAAQADHRGAAAATRDALMSGATGFDRLELSGSVAHGDLVLDKGHLLGAAGEADISGSVGLASDVVDLGIVLRPAVPEPPEIALRLSGSLDHPNRSPGLAGLSRWLADRVQ